MKSNQMLSIFIILFILNSILCAHSHSHSHSKSHSKSHSHSKFFSHSKSKLNSESKTEDADNTFKGYFYIQRFYPGNDAIDSINESEFHSSLMFFVVNKDVIYFTKSLRRIQDIEGKIKIIKI